MCLKTTSIIFSVIQNYLTLFSASHTHIWDMFVHNICHKKKNYEPSKYMTQL